MTISTQKEDGGFEQSVHDICVVIVNVTVLGSVLF